MTGIFTTFILQRWHLIYSEFFHEGNHNFHHDFIRDMNLSPLNQSITDCYSRQNHREWECVCVCSCITGIWQGNTAWNCGKRVSAWAVLFVQEYKNGANYTDVFCLEGKKKTFLYMRTVCYQRQDTFIHIPSLAAIATALWPPSICL